MPPLRAVVIALAIAAGFAAPAAAQGVRYALLVQGASGEPQYAKLHREWLDQIHTLVRDRFKFDPARIKVLAETAAAGEERATAVNVTAALQAFAAAIKPDDLLFVMLIGHGGGQGADARFNLIGPDLGAEEWGALLKPIQGQIAFVDSTSASSPYLAGVAGPNRVVITATRSTSEKFHTQFPGAFIKALDDAAADADKNQRISILEAFQHASRLVAASYEQSGHMVSEHAMFDDTGDGQGRTAAEDGPDGAFAGMTYLDTVAMPTSSDPAVQALITKQAALMKQIDELRRQRTSMPPIAFDQQFEPLMIELALVSREVRRKVK
jgi:hypothetical protein